MSPTRNLCILGDTSWRGGGYRLLLSPHCDCLVGTGADQKACLLPKQSSRQGSKSKSAYLLAPTVSTGDSLSRLSRIMGGRPTPSLAHGREEVTSDE